MALTVARPPSEVTGGFHQPNQVNIRDILDNNTNNRQLTFETSSNKNQPFPLVCPVQSVHITPKLSVTHHDEHTDHAAVSSADWSTSQHHILDRNYTHSINHANQSSIPRIATIQRPIGRLLSLPSFDLKAFRPPILQSTVNTRSIPPTFRKPLFHPRLTTVSSAPRPSKDKFLMPEVRKPNHNGPPGGSRTRPDLVTRQPGGQQFLDASQRELFMTNPINASEYLLNVISTPPKSTTSSFSPVRQVEGTSGRHHQSRHQIMYPDDFPHSPAVTSVVVDRNNEVREPTHSSIDQHHPSGTIPRSSRSTHKTNYLNRRMYDDERRDYEEKMLNRSRGSRHGRYMMRGDVLSDEGWSTIASTEGGDTRYAELLRHSGRVAGRNGVRKYVHSAARRYGSSTPMNRMMGGEIVAYPTDMYERKSMMLRSPSNGMLVPWTPLPSPPIPSVTDMSLSPVASTSMLTCNSEFRRQFPYVYQGLCKGMIDITRLMAHEIVIPVKEEIAIKRSTVRSRKSVTNSVSDRLWRVLQGRFPDPGVAPKLIRRMAEYFYDKIEFGIQDAEDERSFIQWLFRFDVENAIDLRQSISLGAGKNAVLAHIEGSAHINRKKGDLFNLIGPDVIQINLECIIKVSYRPSFNKLYS